MLDTHCHLLPGIDDGAQNEQDALRMARCAVDDGITEIIVTPHQLVDRFQNLHSDIVPVFERTKELFIENEINLNIYLGAEVHFNSTFWEKEGEGELTTLADTQYMLIEFSPRVLPRIIETAIDKLVTRGYKPIIAHPERIPAFDLNSPLIEYLKSMGAFYQITAHSIDGTFGKKMQRYAKKWVMSNNCHLIATDAHNCSRRAPILSNAFKVLSRWTKSRIACEIISVENTRRLLANEKLTVPRLERKSFFGAFAKS